MGYKTSGVSDEWGIRRVGYQTSGVSDEWGIRRVGYQTSGVSDEWPVLESKRLRLPNDDLFVKFLLYGHDNLNIDMGMITLTLMKMSSLWA